MTIAEILEKMICYSNGNIHDIDHLVRVWTFAKTIGELEHIDARRSTYWKLPLSRMTLPALSAERNTAALTASIRNSKAGLWFANFCMILA